MNRSVAPLPGGAGHGPDRVRRRRRLPWGPRIALRELRPGDVHVLDDVFAGLSPASRRQRYLADVPELSERARAVLADVDGRRHVAVVAEVRVGRATVPVGIARYVAERPTDAEIAYEVVDEWHGRGVGRALLRELAGRARAAGVERFHATIHRDNVASMGLLRKELPAVRVRRDGELLEVVADLGSELRQADVLADLGLQAA